MSTGSAGNGDDDDDGDDTIHASVWCGLCIRTVPGIFHNSLAFSTTL